MFNNNNEFFSAFEDAKRGTRNSRKAANAQRKAFSLAIDINHEEWIDIEEDITPTTNSFTAEQLLVADHIRKLVVANAGDYEAGIRTAFLLDGARLGFIDSIEEAIDIRDYVIAHNSELTGRVMLIANSKLVK